MQVMAAGIVGKKTQWLVLLGFLSCWFSSVEGMCEEMPVLKNRTDDTSGLVYQYTVKARMASTCDSCSRVLNVNTIDELDLDHIKEIDNWQHFSSSCKVRIGRCNTIEGLGENCTGSLKGRGACLRKKRNGEMVVKRCGPCYDYFVCKTVIEGGRRTMVPDPQCTHPSCQRGCQNQLSTQSSSSHKRGFECIPKNGTDWEVSCCRDVNSDPHRYFVCVAEDSVNSTALFDLLTSNTTGTLCDMSDADGQRKCENAWDVNKDIDDRAHELIEQCDKKTSRKRGNLNVSNTESLNCSVCSLASKIGRHLTKVGPRGFLLSLPCKALNGRTAAVAVVLSSDLANDSSSAPQFSNDTGLDVSHDVILATDVVSIILALQDTGDESFSFQDNPVEFELLHNHVITGNAKRVCTFWKIFDDETYEGVWSSQGCTVVKESANSTTCSCNHLTNFAVLIQLNEEPLPPDDEKALNILSILGGSLSIICLAFMLVIYAVLKMYKTERGMVHANLSVALLMSQLIFLTGIDAHVSNRTACKAVAVLLHYLLLAMFSWMLIEGILLYVSAKFAFHRVRRWQFLLLGWGSPVPVVLISLASAFDSYGTDENCWLNGASKWAFIAPVIFVMMVNVVFLIYTLAALLKLQVLKSKTEVAKIKVFTRALLIVQPVMGFAWLFGLGLNTAEDSKLFFYYLFVILNSSQGVFIFFLYCLNTDEVKQAFGRVRRQFSRRLKPHASSNATMNSINNGNKEMTFPTVSEAPDDGIKSAWI
ncbi:adhesion G protein-coupled receptor L3-like [Acanthaster planci]|uniref:Adhesion G protein-coupled receptor L3-like n=1 Tax=Acanthaster planci TaxID=133434 RepID=A0A8B7ZFS3_ACAPL|nr:adhesion G protein-coupled receptor L3-like [Acanthaster planci]